MEPRREDTAVIGNEMRGGIQLTSGFLKYPSQRDIFLKNAEKWIEGKREDDGVYPYWRIHNKLYNLTKFVDKHPGGKFWLEITQGTDITEAFESSHFGPIPEQFLNKYFVKDILTPRNSPFTFKENGFYQTLKRKVSPIINEVGKGPKRSMLFIQDSLFFGFLVFAILASLQNCVLYAAVASVFLCLGANASHNFFHQRDNWRMYIFDMMFLSSREWRISHALSHHIFPNTIYDYEISVFEPHLELLPKFKSFRYRHEGIVRVSVLYVIGFYFNFIVKVILSLSGEVKFQMANFLPFAQLVLMMVLSGSLQQSLWLWLVLHTIGNLLFQLIGLTAAHHHPEIYHEGDEPHRDKDWGLHQVATTRERGELFMNSVFLASVSYGNHTLHHLFPTVDQSKLPYLQSVFLETCQEFGIRFEVFTIWKLFKGFFTQIALIKPNPNSPECFKYTNIN